MASSDMILQKENKSDLAYRKRRWSQYLNGMLARELSRITRYYDRVIQWIPRKDDSRQLIHQLDAKVKEVIEEHDHFPNLNAEYEYRSCILINGTLNHHFDVQELLMTLKPKLARTSRLLIILYNPYFRWLYLFANRIGIRSGEAPSTFLRRVDLQTLAKISGFEIVRERPIIYCPFALLGLGDVINRVFIVLPLLRWLSLVHLSVWRPIIAERASGLSCVIPARNERGNIESALRRFPNLGCNVEIIFVEGHSTDGTWEEILRVREAYKGKFVIRAFQQTGRGKSDAVRMGFARATQPLLTILDADLTMPPEFLARFYEAYNNGYGDFVNGSRLVYPMEGQAMRPLNRLGNIFFTKMLSWSLEVRLSDCLCGTKLLARHDYARLEKWRQDFGDFDPFGDFELLFPASTLGLGIIDIPVRYLARTYGSTNIRRFRHGLQLLKMTLIGFLRIQVGFDANRS